MSLSPLPLLRAFLPCALAGFVGVGCTTPPPQGSASSSTVDVAEVTQRIPKEVKDRAGWASDIVNAIREAGREPTLERACAVIAVIRQESGFQVDPRVPDLPRIVREGLEEKLKPLGPLADPTLDALLSVKVPGSGTSFSRRIAQLDSERDLDQLFRELDRAYQQKLPGTYAVTSALSVVLGKGSLRELNPVTTAGSMQVKIDYARKVLDDDGLSDDVIRDLLYTRAGGVKIGTARLLSYRADYDDIIFRFADYNAGLYASRNAAFQSLLSDLTGKELARDGDLLAYDDDHEPKDFETESLQAMLGFGISHDISSWTVKRDAKKEKTKDFEETTTWKKVRDSWEKKKGRTAPYAMLPEVKLSSPKLSKKRSTAWFARSVKHHYQDCREGER